MIQKTITVILLAISLSSCGGGKPKQQSVTCDANNEGYKSGYNAGKTSLWDTPEEHKRECNNGTGMIGEVPPCWDEGFRAAKQ